MLLVRYVMLSECAFVLGVILPLFADAEAVNLLIYRLVQT